MRDKCNRSSSRLVEEEVVETREREREREMDKKHVDQGRSFDGIEINTIESRLRERERASSFVIVLSNE